MTLRTGCFLSSLLCTAVISCAPQRTLAQAAAPDGGPAPIAPPPNTAPASDAPPSSPPAPQPPAAQDTAQAPPSLTPEPPTAAAEPPVPPPSAAPSLPDTYGASARTHRLAPGETAPYGTGSHLNVPLEELPASVNIVDQRTLQERGVQTLDQALWLSPGVVPTWQYGGFMHLSLRGLSAVTAYDGHRDARAIFADSAPQSGLLDIERVEVLRGPASVLYGYGAVGGVINLIRKQPSRDPKYELSLGLGLPNQRIVSAGAQGPLGELFSCRVDIGNVTREDFRGARTERNQVSAAVRFTPTRRHTFNFRLGYARDRYNTDVGIPTVEDPAHPGTWHLPPGARYGNRYGTNNDHLAYQRIDLNVDYRFDISNSTSLQARGFLVDDNYTYLAAESLTYVPGMGSTPASVDREYLGFRRGWRPIVGQLELHTEVMTGPLRHQLLAGYEINLFQGSSDRLGELDVLPGSIGFATPVDNAPVVGLSRNAIDHYRHLTHSLYGFDHLHLLDSLIVTGGMRLDLVRSRVQRELVDPELDTTSVDPDTGRRRPALKDHVEAVTGQVGVVYTPVTPVTAYVSYSSSFTPVFIYPSDKGPNDFAPERGQQGEVGVRLRFSSREHSFGFDGAAFYIQKRNVKVPSGPDDFIQAGKVRSRGFELAAHYVAPRFIELDAGYSYTLATYQSFVSADPVTGDNVDRRGNAVGFAPRHGVNAWLRFLITKQLGLGVGVRAVAKQFADDENRVPMPDYALLDASVFIRGEHASFIVSAQNLLDSHGYFTSAINTWAPNPQLTPGPGREILGTLKLTY